MIGDKLPGFNSFSYETLQDDASERALNLSEPIEAAIPILNKSQNSTSVGEEE